jgi:hypothetical protein
VGNRAKRVECSGYCAIHLITLAHVAFDRQGPTTQRLDFTGNIHNIFFIPANQYDRRTLLR